MMRMLAGLFLVCAGANLAWADDDIYTLEVEETRARVGQEATLAVKVKGAKGYKANAEYPNAIKDLKADGAARLAATQVAGKVQAEAITFAVKLVPSAKGTTKVSGDIRFSVCNDKSCKVKRVPLTGLVTAE